MQRSSQIKCYLMLIKFLITTFYILLCFMLLVASFVIFTNFNTYEVSKNVLSTIGLIMDIIGILIIAHLVNETFRGVALNRISSSNAPLIIRKEFKNKIDKTLSTYGYWYIIIGFSIQIFTIWI